MIDANQLIFHVIGDRAQRVQLAGLPGTTVASDLAGLRDDLDYPKASGAEIKAMKDDCSPEEWASLGQQACAILGETWEA